MKLSENESFDLLAAIEVCHENLDNQGTDTSTDDWLERLDKIAKKLEKVK